MLKVEHTIFLEDVARLVFRLELKLPDFKITGTSFLINIGDAYRSRQAANLRSDSLPTIRLYKSQLRVSISEL